MNGSPRRYVMRGPLVRRAMHKPGAARELYYTVLYLSDKLERSFRFGKGGRLRIEGELEGAPIALALQPSPGENHYLMVSKSLMEKTGALIGDTVTLRFSIADPDTVNVPDELADALARQPSVRTKWERLTPGKRRTWCAYVARVKRPQTRCDKANEVVDRVARGLTHPRDPWP